MRRPSSGLAWQALAFGWILAGGLVSAAPAGGEPQTDIWQEALIHPFDSIVLTEQQIDRFLARLSQSNPDRAKELEKMRLSHPQQFRWEIREEMTKRFFQSVPPADKPKESDKPKATPGTETKPPKLDDAAQKKRKELLAWLGKNFPQQADELKANPGLSAERINELYARYESVMQAERNHPELADVMKEDLRVQMHRDELLMDLQYADPAQRDAIIAELEKLVATRFDLIVRKRELQYELLQRRLARLQRELENQKKELDLLKTAKDKSVDARVKELVETTDKTNWN